MASRPIIQDSVLDAHLANFHLPEAGPDDKARILHLIEDRRQQLAAGLARVPEGWQERLRAALAHEDVRLRWDFEHQCYVMDQWIMPPGTWHLVVILADGPGQPHPLNERTLTFLQSCDVRRRGTVKERLEEKREQAAHRREGNSKAADEAVMAAVDTLSEKQIRTVLDVERAFHSGETVEFRGRDAAFVEKSIEAERRGATMPGGSPMNPGMHPRVHRRKRR